MMRARLFSILHYSVGGDLVQKRGRGRFGRVCHYHLLLVLVIGVVVRMWRVRRMRAGLKMVEWVVRLSWSVELYVWWRRSTHINLVVLG